MTEQTCRTCGVVKPVSSFELRKDTGKLRTQCKPCRSNHSAVRRYGVTLGEIEQLRDKQGNSCAICGTNAADITHAAFSHNPLVIDHCHASGEVRGLLCPNCNTGLGQFKDDISLLAKAITYLSS